LTLLKKGHFHRQDAKDAKKIKVKPKGAKKMNQALRGMIEAL
jgi:hypothetical protein